MSVELIENSESAEQEVCHTDVLILGAGLAGLGAATKISNASNVSDKFKYLILEAQNRAGGRVKTEEFRSFSKNKNEAPVKNSENNFDFVDAGAQWLHGCNNFLYTISQNYQLLSAHQSEEGMGSFFRENGNRIDPYLVKKVDFRIGELLGECEEFARSKKTVDFPKSVGQFLREKFEIFIDCLENLQDKENAMDLFDWHVRFQIIDNSCLSLDQLSAKYWGRYSFNGESCQAHYNFKNGFGTIIDCLIGELNKKSIHFNKEVTEICIHNKQMELNNNNHNNINKRPSNQKIPNISVKCSDGSLYTADHVIVTFSLGYLKKVYKTLFHPNLPSSVHLAIESIGFETINKVFMEFDTPWWHDLGGIQFVFKQNKKVNAPTIEHLVFRYNLKYRVNIVAVKINEN